MAPLITSFDPTLDLIVVDIQLDGRRHSRRYSFALDTGCSETLVTHEALAAIGYQARDGEETATASSPFGEERGYLLRVARITALGHAIENFRVYHKTCRPMLESPVCWA